MKALKRTSLLQIDSHSLPVPTGSPTIKFSDVESSDSGADEMGVYHREVLRYGVLTASLVVAGFLAIALIGRRGGSGVPTGKGPDEITAREVAS